MGNDVHPRRVEPNEERLVVSLRLVDECECLLKDFVVHRLHPLRKERAGVLDPLLADFAPAGLHRRIVAIRRPRVDHVARSDRRSERRRIVAVGRISIASR